MAFKMKGPSLYKNSPMKDESKYVGDQIKREKPNRPDPIHGPAIKDRREKKGDRSQWKDRHKSQMRIPFNFSEMNLVEPESSAETGK